MLPTLQSGDFIADLLVGIDRLLDLFFFSFSLMQEYFIGRRFARRLFEESLVGDASGKQYLVFCAILAAAWLPHMIIKYPGAMCWDSWQMLTQYRHHTITNFHSPYYSVLIGFSTGLFEKNGHAEYGLYLFAVFHFYYTPFL